MNIRHGQTPIPLPTIVDDPRWIGRFSREVRKSIAALRDRKIVVNDAKRAKLIPPLPFAISVTEDSLVAAAGTIDADTHPKEVKEGPADGIWYFEAKLVLNATTGETVSTDVQWVNAESSDTSTDFYLTIGEVGVIDGVPTGSTIVQYNYGPILTVITGGNDDAFRAWIF